MRLLLQTGSPEPVCKRNDHLQLPLDLGFDLYLKLWPRAPGVHFSITNINLCDLIHFTFLWITNYAKRKCREQNICLHQCSAMYVCIPQNQRNFLLKRAPGRCSMPVHSPERVVEVPHSSRQGAGLPIGQWPLTSQQSGYSFKEPPQRLMGWVNPQPGFELATSWLWATGFQPLSHLAGCLLFRTSLQNNMFIVQNGSCGYHSPSANECVLRYFVIWFHPNRY